MFNDSTIFEKHYEDYMRRISEMDVTNLNRILGIQCNGHRMTVPFFDSAVWERTFLNCSGL